MRWLAFFFAIPVVAFLCGCSTEDEWTKSLPATVDATGYVTLDGEPVEGASIVFAPADGKTHAAKALSDSSGYFSLDAFPSKTGAVPGDYKILVTKTMETKGGTPPPDSPAAKLSESAMKEGMAHAQEDSEEVHWVNVLPKKYNNPNTSGLKATIPEGGTSDLNLELTSK